MRFVWKYLSEYKKESILAPLFKMSEAIFELLVPLIVAAIIDKGIPDRNEGYVIRMALLLVLFAALGYAVAIMAQYFSAKAAINAAGSMRRDLFYHISGFSECSMDRVGASALVTRLTSDINQVQNGINMFLRLFLRSPFIVFGAAICAFTVDVKGALVFAVALPLLSLVVYLVMKTTLPRYSRIGKKLERLTLIVSENLAGVRVIRAFRNEEAQRNNFDQETDGLYREQMCAGGVQSILSPVTVGVVNLSLVVILWVGGHRVNNGALTTGQVVALLNYMSQILIELIKLANLIILLTKALASVERIEGFMGMEQDEREFVREQKSSTTVFDLAESTSRDISNESGSGHIASVDSRSNVLNESISNMVRNTLAVCADSLRFSYADEDEDTLTDISFSLKRGGMLGIIGGTGSGKSTIANLIRHVYDISGGSLTLFGNPTNAYSDKEISKLVGIVPQEAQLFVGTIADNLRMAKSDATDDELWEALEAAQAKDFVKAKPGGLGAKVQRGGRNFSGGQRQRLTIARALVSRAPLIILDDSSSALDMATEKALRTALAQLSWKPALIVISQRASSVMDADSILVMEGGECAGYGTNDELLESCQIYRDIYRTQFEEVA